MNDFDSRLARVWRIVEALTRRIIVLEEEIRKIKARIGNQA